MLCFTLFSKDDFRSEQISTEVHVHVKNSHLCLEYLKNQQQMQVHCIDTQLVLWLLQNHYFLNGEVHIHA